MFMKVFNSLPFGVVWKSEGELSDEDDNVITVDWLPQTDFFAHPKGLLLITHDGLMSIHESFNLEVPIIIIR